jgi:hypothetical protein
MIQEHSMRADEVIQSCNLDLEDINELLKLAERTNVVRQLEDFKLRINSRIESEKKNAEKFHKFDNVHLPKYQIITAYTFEDSSQFAK